MSVSAEMGRGFSQYPKPRLHCRQANPLLILPKKKEPIFFIRKLKPLYLWEKVFINQMSATLLRRRAFPIAILNETTILCEARAKVRKSCPHQASAPSTYCVGKKRVRGGIALFFFFFFEVFTHDLLTSRLPRLVQGVVILGNVQRKIVRCGEVAAALEAAVDVRLGVVHFIRFIGGEGQGLPMRRQRAKHHVGSSSGGGGGGGRGGSPVKVTITVEMGVFGWLFASFRRSRRCVGA